MDQALAIQTAIDFIRGAEGFSPSPYFDVNGYAIGYGNHYYEDGTAVQQSDADIDQQTAEDLSDFFINQNLQAIQAQLTVPLNENQLAALTSIRYNCGTITTTLLNLINSGASVSAVAAQIQQTCITAGGQPDSDLVTRRASEASLYSTAVGGISTNNMLLIGLGIALVIGVAVIAMSDD
jgi:lysozyme